MTKAKKFCGSQFSGIGFFPADKELGPSAAPVPWAELPADTPTELWSPHPSYRTRYLLSHCCPTHRQSQPGQRNLRPPTSCQPGNARSRCHTSHRLPQRGHQARRSCRLGRRSWQFPTSSQRSQWSSCSSCPSDSRPAEHCSRPSLAQHPTKTPTVSEAVLDLIARRQLRRLYKLHFPVRRRHHVSYDHSPNLLVHTV